MPMFDLQCDTCATVEKDVYQRTLAESVERPCACGGIMQKAWLKAPGVIGDECDIQAKHGICNPDGTPRRFTSKQEMAREAQRRGLTNFVVHNPPPDSDRSKHTSRWI